MLRVFFGLTPITVDRHANIDFNRGVRAEDARTGAVVEFTVNYSGVNTANSGTSYAIYTATDSRGNTTTARRQVTVRRDQEDVNREFNAFFDRHLAGQSPAGVVSTIRRIIRFNTSWGRPNPIEYGLTNMRGNCYVRARMVEAALNRMGVQNRLIWTVNRCHYWNLIHVNGVWRHFDSTPGQHTEGPLTDAQKLACRGMGGRTWDRSAWPAAN